jgi:SAM-dependent methyltransferase
MSRRRASRGLDLLLGITDDEPAAGLDPELTTQLANARNNARFQELRLDRWHATRDAMWALLAPHLTQGARTLIVGAGNGDDLPLARIAARAGAVLLVDIDPESAERAMARLPEPLRARVEFLELDVTDGGAQVVVDAITDGREPPFRLELPTDAIAGGAFDVVLADMLFTQLLQPALVQLGLSGPEQVRLMRAYDGQLTEALVQRLQRSAAAGGVVMHVHDVACWSSSHPQPMELDAALENPDHSWGKLRRHDACDPQLTLERLGVRVLDRAWWRWPFEPKKQFLVRGTIAAPGLPRD